MAKVASTKPYGRGKSTPTTPKKGNPAVSSAVANSPIRTSPRRRKEVEEPATTVVTSKVKAKAKPSIPLFSEPTQKKPKKNKNTRRKESVIERNEPENESSIEQLEPENENESEIEDYVESFLTESTRNDVDYDDDDNDDEKNVNSGSSEVYEYNDDETSESYGSYGHEDDEEEPFHFDSSSNHEGYEDQQENSEILNEQVQFNQEFRYSSQTVRSRLSEYFNRQETTKSKTLDAAMAVKNRLWNNMKTWFSESVLEGAKELGEFTKRTIESLTKREEKEEMMEVEGEVDFYHEESEGDDVHGENGDGDYNYDAKRIKMMYDDDDSRTEEVRDEIILTHQEEAQEHEESTTMIPEQTPFSSLNSSTSSYHSIPVVSGSGSGSRLLFNTDVLDSRLTEIILFLAKCTSSTPISLIYEHLEELFTLKGEVSLNLTEKQLVSTVLRDFLTESDDDKTSLDSSMVPSFEPLILTTNASAQNTNVRVLPSSGIRFRAPKFTPEEEARLEASELARTSLPVSTPKGRVPISTVNSTPMQRIRIQRKLLPLERTADLLSSLPENRIRASNTRISDDQSTSIEEIISQKIQESRRREELERVEREKLKNRVAELEREARDRSTKEVLLQKQLDEQKKELELEREAARAQTKANEQLKAAQAAKSSNTSTSTSNIVGSEQVKSTYPTFGNKSSSESSVQPAATLKPFEFGSSSSNSGNNTVNAASAPVPKFGFSFAAKETVVDGDGDKKVSEETPKFTFNSSTDVKPFATAAAAAAAAAAPLSNPFSSTFSFGAASTQSATDKDSSPVDEKKASSFNFGEKASVPAFNFGNDKKTSSDPAKPPPFNFGSDKTSSSDKTTSNPFNFGASAATEVKPPSTSTRASTISAGTTTSTPSFNFGASGKTSSSANAFTFTSTPTTSSSSSSSGNPFAALNSSSSLNILNSSSTTAAPSFSFGNPSAASTPVFTFPSTGVNSSNTNNFNFGGIVPMNFGGASSDNEPGVNSSNANSASNQGPMEMSFQTGNAPRSISIPKRRRR